MKNLEHVTKCLIRMGGEVTYTSTSGRFVVVKVGNRCVDLEMSMLSGDITALVDGETRYRNMNELLRRLLYGPGNMKIVKNGGKKVGDYGKGFSQMVNMSMTVRVWGEILPGGNVRYTLRTYGPDSCPTAVYPCPPRLGLDFLQGTIPANLIWDYFTDLGIPLPPGGCDD